MVPAKQPQKDPIPEDRGRRSGSLLLFGFLYGQMTGAVLTLVVVVRYLSSPTGHEWCQGWGMDLLPCQAGAAVLVLVVFGVSGFLGARQLIRLGKRERGSE